MRNSKWFKLLIVLLIASILIIGATQRFDTIIAKKIVITGSGGFELGDNSGSFDLNGKELTLDADDDSSITCDTDDQCDWELGGQDEYVLTAAVFDIGEGTLSRIDLDADNDTSVRSSTDDQINLELGGADQFVLKIPPAPVTGSQTTRLFELAATTPVYTNGTNVLTGLNVDLAIGNATGGTNTIDAIGIDDITGDAQVTETGLSVGTGFDIALDVQGQRIDLDADNDSDVIASFDDVITFTVGAATGHVDVATGNLKVGDGTPSFTQDGEDAYFEGAVELASDSILGAQATISITFGTAFTPTGRYQPISSFDFGAGAGQVATAITAPTDDTNGKLLLLTNVNATQVITIDGTGTTVECKADIVMGPEDMLSLLWNGDDWNCISFYDNS